MEVISSAQNPRLKHLAKLSACAKTRRQYGQAVLAGRHLVQAYLDAGGVPEQVFVSEADWAHGETAALLARLPENRIAAVRGTALARAESVGCGMAALIGRPYLPPPPQSGCCVLLDGVQDPGNVGTLLRTAAAAGVEAVLLGAGCAEAWSPKVLRAGMGAHFVLPVYEQTDLAAWCAAYRGRVLAAALYGASPCGLYEADLCGETAWLFGNEGAGVSPELLARADTVVRIPMAEGVESLNVAAAAAVCLFEQVRQKRYFQAA